MSASLHALYSDNGQTYADNLRRYLDAQGVPPTAENLNRISLAVSQAMRGAEVNPQFEAAMSRQMGGGVGTRGAAMPTPPIPPQQAGPQLPQPMSSDPEGTAQLQLAQASANAGASGALQAADQPPVGATRGQQISDVNAMNGGASGAAAAGAYPNDTVRPGTIPRASYIDENDPLAGMFNPQAPGGRQADETGVSQGGLGAALVGIPAAALAGSTLLPGMLARGATNLPAVANPYANITGITMRQPPPAPAMIPRPSTPPSGGPGTGAAAQLPSPASQLPRPAASPAPPRTSQDFTPAQVTVQGRNGASAVRGENSPESAGRTALTRRMMGGDRRANRPVSETSGRRRDGARGGTE